MGNKPLVTGTLGQGVGWPGMIMALLAGPNYPHHKYGLIKGSLATVVPEYGLIKPFFLVGVVFDGGGWESKLGDHPH